MHSNDHRFVMVFFATTMLSILFLSFVLFNKSKAQDYNKNIFVELNLDLHERLKEAYSYQDELFNINARLVKNNSTLTESNDRLISQLDTIEKQFFETRRKEGKRK